MMPVVISCKENTYLSYFTTAYSILISYLMPIGIMGYFISFFSIHSYIHKHVAVLGI